MRPMSALAATLAAATLACSAPPVEWSEPRPVSVAQAAGALVLEPGAAPRLVDAEAPAYVPDGACPASVRVARGTGGVRYAIWWAPRADSSALLLAARSADAGATWGAPVPVDTADVSHLGCARPAPAVAVDTVTGYVHAAYWMEAPEGAGVFFAHSMEEGAMYHWPVLIVYGGDRPSQVAIAAEDSTVAVAYQDPNGRLPRIAIALSRTNGHLFEHRLPPMTIAGDSAFAPRVAVGDGRLAVAWREERRLGTGREAAFVRTGIIR